MRRQYLILGAIVVVGAAVFLLWPRRGGNTGTPEISESTPEFAVANSSDHSNAVSVEPQHGDPDVAVPRTKEERDYVAARDERFRLSNEADNPPVAFFGKVVDQDSNALQNVAVDLEVAEEYVDPYPQVKTKITPLQRQTGADGQFEVSGAGLKGKYVLVKVLTKAGYERETSERAMFGTQSTSSDNPAVFRMWSTNIPHEHLIIGDVSSVVIPDGRRYGIDITNRTVIEGAEGDLTVWLKRPAKVGWEKYDWSCELDANGGLLEDTGDQPMLIAPETGYNNVFAFNQEADSNDWTGGLYGKRFYLRLPNGQIYGRITVDLDVDLTTLPTHKAPAMLRIKYVINPSGSRLLR